MLNLSERAGYSRYSARLFLYATDSWMRHDEVDTLSCSGDGIFARSCLRDLENMAWNAAAKKKLLLIRRPTGILVLEASDTPQPSHFHVYGVEELHGMALGAALVLAARHQT